MKLQEAFREIQSLKKRVRSLTKEIESIRRISIGDSSPVEGLLRMRGIRVFRKNPVDRLFFPSDLSGSYQTRFYEMMKRYSFRLVLRDMIKNQDGFKVRDLTHYCSSKVVRRYCQILCDMGVIIKSGRASYRTGVRPLYSFGPTLEWFIAEMFKREFASPAIYGVSVKKTRSGGDYDVMASWNQRLVYAEVKSSPPKGVEQAEISTFFSRLEDLLPDVAILFNDTQLRMKDKLVVMFEEALSRRYGEESKKLYPVERLIKELFHIQHRIFIVNSKKDVVENFGICLRDYLRYGIHSLPPLPLPTGPLPTGRQAVPTEGGAGRRWGEGRGEGFPSKREKVKNKELADLFERMADILEFKNENPFKISAYRKASRILGDLTQDIEEIAGRGELKKIPGIGEGMSQKIEEYLKTGKVSKFEEVKKGVSDELIAMMDIPGMGPKTLALLHKERKIENLSQLEKAVEDGSLIGLPGMGEKKVENIRRGIQLLKQSKGRMNLGMAFPVAKRIVEAMRERTGSEKIEWAGSLRRMRENIGDIDLLATGKDLKKIVQTFTHLPEVKEVLASGETKVSVIVEGGLQIDLRVVEEGSYGAALQYFTGSKGHNIHLRGIAKARGIKINEYGVFKGEKKIGGKEEKDVYKALGMVWIEPELREDRGEIEAAQEKNLPKLVEESEVKGDLHVHSNWSDGTSSIEEIARAAQKIGYQYVAICDHTKSLKITHGLDETRLMKQMEEIDRLNEKMKTFQILKGTEVDILADGRLDLSEKVLEKLDIVIAAIHSGFKQDREKMTKRIIRAIENPLVNIIAHPSGRLLGARDPYEVDIDEVMEAAKKYGKALEINAYFERLDLDDIHCRKAKEMSIRVAIGTDTHHLDQMWMMSLGVAVARRGWLETQDILNTLSLKEILKWRGETG